MESLDEKIDALARNDEVIQFAEKIGVEPDRLAKWLVASADPIMEKNIPAVINLLLDLMETHA